MTSQSQPVTWTSGIIATAWIGVVFLLIAVPVSYLWQGLSAEDLNPASWRAAWTDQRWMAQLVGTVTVASLAAGVAAALALPAAIGLDRAPGPLKLLACGLAVAIFTAPFDVATTPVAAWIAELGAALTWPEETTALTTLGIGYGIRFATLLFLILTIAVHYCDRTQSEAALCHGVDPLTAWFRFTWPQLAPALVLGVVWVGLYALFDPTLPAAQGVDQLLAPIAYHQSGRDTGSHNLAQAAITLTLLGLVTIALAWRALVRASPHNASLIGSTNAAQPGIASSSLLLGVLALMTALAWHSREITGLNALSPWLYPMLVTGTLYAVLGAAAAIVVQRADPMSRFVQQSLPLLLMLPPFVVINALNSITDTVATAGASPSHAALVVSGLALTAPWLVLVAYVGRHLETYTSPGIANLSESCGGPTRGTPRRIATMGILRLAIGLFCFGAALAIIEANPATSTFLPALDITP